MLRTKMEIVENSVNTLNDKLVPAVLIFAVFYVGSVLISRALTKLSKHYDARACEPFRLISNSQRAVMIFIGAVLALSKLGFDVSALVAGLGLTGFALGFALKDAISNLVAGIMIVLYRPVELGETIEVAGEKGEVVDINLRYITISNEGVTHLVPNSLLLKNKVSIFNRNH